MNPHKVVSKQKKQKKELKVHSLIPHITKKKGIWELQDGH
jgi:hypothetical protein